MAQHLEDGAFAPNILQNEHAVRVKSAAELRRLAPVEQELEALKRAISEAEPVAWLSSRKLPALKDPDDEGGKYMPLRKAPLGNFDVPLYTLKGIK
ncbi:MAG: hypothetical protein ACKO0Z_21955 [Betaproteobacteria bacterium]